MLQLAGHVPWPWRCWHLSCSVHNVQRCRLIAGIYDNIWARFCLTRRGRNHDGRLSSVTGGDTWSCLMMSPLLEIRHNSLFVTSGLSPRVTWCGRDTGCWLWVRASCLKMRYYKALVSAILTNALGSMLSSAKPSRPPIPTSAFSLLWQVLILGFYVKNQKYSI